MIPFSPPRMDKTVTDAVTEALMSGWITTGPRTKEFERQLSEYCGVKKSICLNSWTNATELFFRYWGLGPGDEVILPAYTYSATANVVVHCGAQVVLVDVDVNGLMDFSKLKAAITSKTKIIMPVDLGGLPVNYDELIRLVNEPGIKALFKGNNEMQSKLGRIMVFADAAHSIGAKKGKAMSGAFADVTGFSFHAVKNLTTGEGGALLFNLPEAFDVEEIYKALNIKSLHGQTKDAFSKTQPGAWQYDIVEAGFKCNMTDIQAAIGLVELARYESETLPKRKALAENYLKLLKDKSWAILPAFMNGDYETSYHLFMLKLKGFNEAMRNEVISEMGALKIATNVHFRPLPMLSFYEAYGLRIADYPGAYNYYANEISLPLFYDLTFEQQEFLVKSLTEIVKKIQKS